MKTMTKFMFSALCAAAMVTSVSAQGGKDMLSNGIKYLDVPYVAHTLEADGPEELVINCDEVDCTTLVDTALSLLAGTGRDAYPQIGRRRHLGKRFRR